MAGVGPPPKDPDKRARRNASVIPMRVVNVETAAQPTLPAGINWHEQTRRWWKVWADSPLAAEFTENDWSELLDTAVLHSLFWHGDAKIAGELRLRVAKFGATPEDRARLRIQFATADQAEARSGPSVTGAAASGSRRRLIG